MSVRRAALRLVPFAAAAVLAAAIACGGDEETDFDARRVVSDAANRLEGVDSFHFVLEHENGGTQIVLDLTMTRAEGDFVRPDRLQADLESLANGQRLVLRVIGVGAETWLSNPFNPEQWQLLQGTDVRDILNLDEVPTVMRQVDDVEAAGSAEVDGVETYRVRATVDSGALAAVVPNAAEAGQTVDVEMWVGQDDSLVRRLEVRGSLNPQEPGGIQRRLDLSGFDAPVSIQPPR